MPKHTSFVAALLACLLSALPLAASGQSYPSRPIRVIVPVGQGGGFDLLGRVVASKLGERLAQQVVVENRPGAGSLIGTEAVAKAPHDGYMLLVGGLTNMALNAGLYKNLPYDPVADFKPLSLSVNYSLCLLTRKDLPQSTLKDVIDFARRNPGKLTYASAGVGTAQHVALALLAHLTGTNMVHVPYKGAGAAHTDMLAGRVDLFFNNCGVIKQYVDSGQMKLIAVSWRERTPTFADVPTVMETGLAAFEMDSWIGFFIGARTPQPIIEKLRTEIAAVLALPEIAARLERDGGRLLRLSPAESEAFVQAEVKKWRASIPQMGISAE